MSEERPDVLGRLKNNMHGVNATHSRESPESLADSILKAWVPIASALAVCPWDDLHCGRRQ